MRSLIGLHVRVPKRNTDFICPLVYADRPVGRPTGRLADAKGRERRPDSLIQAAIPIAIPEVETAKSSGRIDHRSLKAAERNVARMHKNKAPVGGGARRGTFPLPRRGR